MRRLRRRTNTREILFTGSKPALERGVFGGFADRLLRVDLFD
jgi:hypothetical protein